MIDAIELESPEERRSAAEARLAATRQDLADAAVKRAAAEAKLAPARAAHATVLASLGRAGATATAAASQADDNPADPASTRRRAKAKAALAAARGAVEQSEQRLTALLVAATTAGRRWSLLRGEVARLERLVAQSGGERSASRPADIAVEPPPAAGPATEAVGLRALVDDMCRTLRRAVR
jgi:hypothetical protein